MSKFINFPLRLLHSGLKEKPKQSKACFIIICCDFSFCFQGKGVQTSCQRSSFHGVQEKQKGRSVYSAFTSSGVVWGRMVKGWKTWKNRQRSNKKKRFECMRSYCACSPPAGESTDQRPFIIWCCKNKTPFSLQLGRTDERTRDKKDDQRRREGQKGWAQPKKSHYSKNIKEQTLESISEEW